MNHSWEGKSVPGQFDDIGIVWTCLNCGTKVAQWEKPEDGAIIRMKDGHFNCDQLIIRRVHQS